MGIRQLEKNARVMDRWVVLHAFPYLRKSLRLGNTQGSLQSGMAGSESETRGRFCDGLSSSVVALYSVGPILTLHGRITAREYVRGQFMQFSKTTMPPFTQVELFSHCWTIMKVNFSIFLGRHSHHIWTWLNHCRQFWRLEWGRDSHLQRLWSNSKMFFKRNGMKFH
jgi:hypothetical protein